MTRQFTLVVVSSFLLLSCGLFYTKKSPPRPSLYKAEYGNKSFEVYVDSFTSKKNLYKQLTGRLKDSTGKIIARYLITSNCGCVSKTIIAKGQYKLTDQLPLVEIPLSPDDKFVFGEFLNIPQINEYCSRLLLDSAKGFIRTFKK